MLDIIHNRIRAYALENNLDAQVFQEAYDSILENDFLFEKNHLNPISNAQYTAQLKFKLDFQNTGVLSNWVFIEIYQNNELFNKIHFLNNAMYAIEKMSGRKPLINKELEWVDEETIRIYNNLAEHPADYYW